VLDPEQRQTARRITERNTRWAVLWGLHSREYWAFPLFPVPPATTVHAPDTPTLLASMHETELAARTHAHAGSRHFATPPPAPNRITR